MALAVEMTGAGHQSHDGLLTPAAAPHPPTAQHLAYTDDEFDALVTALPLLFEEKSRHLQILGQSFGV